MRRVAVWVVWCAAAAAVVLAIGLRVRAARLLDAGQALRAWLVDVPAEVSELGRVVARDDGHLLVELRAHPRWVRVFAQRNGFAPTADRLIGMQAERWLLAETRRPGAIAHLILPQDGHALLTITWP